MWERLFEAKTDFELVSFLGLWDEGGALGVDWGAEERCGRQRDED